MKTKIQCLWLLVCCVLTLIACQKEVSNQDVPRSSFASVASTVMPDDPERVAQITLLKSSGFSLESIVSNDGRNDGSGGGTRGSKKDADGDGIPDALDGCPKQKE